MTAPEPRTLRDRLCGRALGLVRPFSLLPFATVLRTPPGLRVASRVVGPARNRLTVQVSEPWRSVPRRGF